MFVLYTTQPSNNPDASLIPWYLQHHGVPCTVVVESDGDVRSHGCTPPDDDPVVAVFQVSESVTQLVGGYEDVIRFIRESGICCPMGNNVG